VKGLKSVGGGRQAPARAVERCYLKHHSRIDRTELRVGVRRPQLGDPGLLSPGALPGRLPERTLARCPRAVACTALSPRPSTRRQARRVIGGQKGAAWAVAPRFDARATAGSSSSAQQRGACGVCCKRGVERRLSQDPSIWSCKDSTPRVAAAAAAAAAASGPQPSPATRESPPRIPSRALGTRVTAAGGGVVRCSNCGEGRWIGGLRPPRSARTGRY